MRGFDGARLAMTVTGVCVAASFFAAASQQAQTASISGVVVSATTNRPVANAFVGYDEYGTTGSDVTAGVRSDASGRFRLDALAPGRYVVTAEAPGYVRAAYGAAPGLTPTPVAVVAGQEKTDILFRLHRGASISGIVRDHRGEPVVDIGVRAFVRRYERGEQGYTSAALAATDDRGMFRLFGLEPGRYVVAATNMWRTFSSRGAMPPPADTDATTFAPGTTDPSSATVVALKEDEEYTDLAIATSAMQSGIIEGRITGIGAESPGLEVQLLMDQDVVSLAPRRARPQAGGQFMFANVAPGRYRLLAASTDWARPLTWGTLPVVVGRDATTPAAISLRNDVGTVSGDLVTDIPSDVRGLTLFTLVRIGRGAVPGAPRLRILSGGHFELDQIPPGTYGWWVSGPPFVRPSAITVLVGGKDVTDLPLVVSKGTRLEHVKVTVTSAARWGATVEGRVADASGQPTTQGAIVVFSTSNRNWTPTSRRLRDTRADTDGHYEVHGLPAGEYFVAPVARVEPGQVFDPAFLKAISGAIRVTLGQTETRRIDLRLPPNFQGSASKHRPER